MYPAAKFNSVWTHIIAPVYFSKVCPNKAENIVLLNFANPSTGATAFASTLTIIDLSSATYAAPAKRSWLRKNPVKPSSTIVAVRLYAMASAVTNWFINDKGFVSKSSHPYALLTAC